MPVPVSALKAKAQGTLDALEHLTAKQKEAQPTVTFAEDFNKFRKLVLEAAPSIEPVAPPEVYIWKDSFGMQSASTRYGEIEAFYRQLLALLDAEGGK